MIEPTVSLTQDQIDFFHREGYLSIDAISPSGEIEQLREAYDRIFRERAGRDRGDQFDLAGADEEGKEAALPQILNYAEYAPQFKQTLMLANAQRLGEQLLGAGAAAGNAHAIYKPPHHGAETPWHQDEAYWDPKLDYRSLSVWVPLQEATIANGCMHFVPRSHRLDILRHQPIGNDPRVHGLELHLSERHHVEPAVACPLPPGSATIHDARTLHFTPANRSDIPRRAVILGAAQPATKRDEPRRFPWNEVKQTARSQRAKAAQNTAAEPMTQSETQA